jgi:hypothetical protein
MISTIGDCGPPLIDNDIVLLENEIGARLPADYREFLLKHNGGRPSPSAFKLSGLKDNPFDTVQVLFRLGGKVQSSNIDWNVDAFNGRLPSNLLAIGCTDCGDLICLSLFGNDAGSVVYWDYHQEPSEPSYQNVYHIADSFEEFLDSIQELPS